MFYNLTNTAKSARHVVYDVGRRPVAIDIGQTAQVQLTDAIAVSLRRQQMAGSTLHIDHADERGAEILEKAKEPVKPRPFRIVPPIARDRLSRALDEDRAQEPPPLDPPVKDELLEHEQAVAQADVTRDVQLQEPAQLEPAAEPEQPRKRAKSRRR